MNSTKTILVTGGAGYIGSHTIIELLETMDFNVISVDNFSNSLTSTFERIKKITKKEIKNYNINLVNYDELKAVFEKEENIVGVIHFAAFKAVGESVENPFKYYYNNINSLLTILKCCDEFSIPNFIFSSSCSVYGNINKLPVKEDTPFNSAESPYAYTKQVGEEIVKDFAQAYKKLNTIALRYFNPVGAHKSGLIGELSINKPSNLVPIITNNAIGKIKEFTVFGDKYNTRDGTCIRDYVHVSDIANAHVKALMYLVNKKNKSPFSVFNLGTGNGVSVLEAINSFEKTCNVKLNYIIGNKRSGDVEAIYSDTQKSERELGWKPQYTLDQMMQTAWKWELELAKKNNFR